MVFPEEVEKSKNNTHYKPGKENSTEISNFIPISLINAGGTSFRKTINKQNYAPHLQ
jgi:hypothetical protein